MDITLGPIIGIRVSEVSWYRDHRLSPYSPGQGSVLVTAQFDPEVVSPSEVLHMIPK